MNIQARHEKISAEEEARRRRCVAEANWSCQMEGLGEQTDAYNALSELWITGQISDEELDRRQSEMVRDYLKSRGH